MKQARSFGKPPLSRGMSTLEILIAFAILTLSLTAVIMVVFGNQSLAIDTQTNIEALTKAQARLEIARAASREDFNSVVTDTAVSMSGIPYTETLTVTDPTECKKQVISTVSWSAGSRTLTVDLTTFFTDIAGFLALGGDCPTDSSGKKWDDPQQFAFDTLSPGKSTAIDALDSIAYLGSDKKPFLEIADTRAAYLDQIHAQDFFVTYANSFNSDGETINQINDIDVASIDDKVYAFIATASTTAQFAVIDVTDIQNPVFLTSRQLSGVTASDSTAWGWRIYYYDEKVYITARETAGPELHVFNVSNPANPTESPGNGGGSMELNTTVNDFVVRNGLAYLADDSDARGEILIYDVSVPSAITELVGARTNLSGNQNGMSVSLIGAKLYFGRQSTSGGPELYIFDATSPETATAGLPILGTPKEIGGDVLGIEVVDRFGFLVSSKVGEEFQVWNISIPTNITLIKKFNFGNIVAGGMDYEPDFIYATGNATPNFQILYSPT